MVRSLWLNTSLSFSLSLSLSLQATKSNKNVTTPRVIYENGQAENTQRTTERQRRERPCWFLTECMHMYGVHRKLCASLCLSIIMPRRLRRECVFSNICVFVYVWRLKSHGWSFGRRVFGLLCVSHCLSMSLPGIILRVTLKFRHNKYENSTQGKTCLII